MLLVLGVVAVALLGAALVVWAGTRMITHPPEGGTASIGFGAAFEAFDPARARADEDLQSRKQMGEVLPTPDPEHPQWKVDLHRGTVRIPRPR